MTTTTPARAQLEAAQAVMAGAASTLDVASKRLAEAKAAAARLTGEVEAADPDSPTFGALVAQRDAARARVEALAARAQRAEAAVREARQPVLNASAAVQQETIAGIHERARAISARLTGRADAFAHDLIGGLRELAELEREGVVARNGLNTNRGLPSVSFEAFPGNDWNLSPHLVAALLLQADPLIRAVNAAQSGTRKS